MRTGHGADSPRHDAPCGVSAKRRFTGAHVLAVERAIHRISPGSEDAGHFALQQFTDMEHAALDYG
ncbi:MULTISPECIES: hypothetical protein [unclassified Streptomyces]|uniref:hypothetical protein n=1 Tax=unclassified Streptomyces TaxID=2593676 RepID=UPI00039B3646|nr:hypothetical protein [Streptomyces sp. KhCrAH-43]